MPKSVKGNRSFKVDARALLSLGRESIKDNTTALVELVKNSYDADADNVDVELLGDRRTGLIRVADDGVGMSSRDINAKWLRIGFSEKRRKKVSAKGRRETGEKGIGRLSADRLGAMLELRSQKATGKPVAIAVNWDQFDVDGAEIGSVEIQELDDSTPVLPSHGKKAKSGTEIRISKLRQGWSPEDLKALETELSTLVPPAVAVKDFAIWIKTSSKEKFRRVASPFEGVAELHFDGQFDSRGKLSYTISARPRKQGDARVPVEHETIAYSKLLPGTTAKHSVGPVRVQLSYFLRAGVDLGGFSVSQLREYLDTYGGVRIYRDRIRVKPYGDPAHAEGDWLGLAERKVRNPAGAARSEFRIAANQLTGAVYIGRDVNPRLVDSAAREGLVHGEAFAGLKRAVFGCIALLEAAYHRRFVQKKEQESAKAPALPVMVGAIRSSISELKKNLVAVQDAPASPRTAKLIDDSVARAGVLFEQLSAAEKEIEELAGQATVYRGLATVGIASAVFGHETESALAQAKMSSSLALDAVAEDPQDLPLCEEELGKAVEAIEKVAVWGQFALSRVKKDKRKRTKLDISRIVTKLAGDIKPLFDASSIDFHPEVKPDLQLRGFAMDIEALVINLLTNAYHAAGTGRRGRRVEIALSKRSAAAETFLCLKVSDSGPGIAKQYLDRIWAPLFSMKLDSGGKSVGTGLGLTIVRSIAQDLGASINVTPNGRLGGAEFEVLIPMEG